MSFLTLCPACFLAAAAVTLSRQGVTTIPEELSRTMRSARRQSLSQHQQRPLYLAAEATLCLMEGQGRGRGPGQRQQALSLFAKASRGAAQEGYLFQLLAVLRIAVRVFPKFHPAHDYYREWLSQLQQILMAQPPVKLRDIEQAIFPPMPGVGQPAAPLPQ